MYTCLERSCLLRFRSTNYMFSKFLSGKLQGVSILNNLNQGENNKAESQRFLQEAVLTMGNSVRQQLLEEVKLSPCYTILIDETTYVAVVSEMIVYVRYVSKGR